MGEEETLTKMNSVMALLVRLEENCLGANKTAIFDPRFASVASDTQDRLMAGINFVRRCARPTFDSNCARSISPAGEDLAGQAASDVSRGRVIFDPTKDGHGYRYGPAMIINPDGSIDAWFASPGGKGKDGKYQWDWIRHKRSADGGKTWSAETVVLRATASSANSVLYVRISLNKTAECVRRNEPQPINASWGQNNMSSAELVSVFRQSTPRIW